MKDEIEVCDKLTAAIEKSYFYKGVKKRGKKEKDTSTAV